MADRLSGIIAQLEQRKAAIERALAALHSLDGDAPGQAPQAPVKRKGGMTPAGKRRLIAALKKRWAAKKAAEAAPAATSAKAARRKVRITPEGRKRLAEAMKRRWAVKRAASAVKVRRKKAA